jgi:hypothetical protein
MTYTDAAVAAAAGIDYSTFRGWVHRGVLRRPRGGWSAEDACLLRAAWILAVLGVDLRHAVDLCEARRAAITAGRGWLVYLRELGTEPAVLLVTRPEDLVAVTSHGLLRGPQAGVVTIDLGRSREVVLRALREAHSEARLEPQLRREVIA